MKALSTKSAVFNWSVSRSQPSEVLRLRGGTGSPSPSPPPTRPSSPASKAAGQAAAPEPAASSASTIRTGRPSLTIRSRSNLRGSEDPSPVRCHTAPVRTTDNRQRSRRGDTGKITCSNHCGKEFSSERGRNSHENFHCPKRSQVNKMIMIECPIQPYLRIFRPMQESIRFRLMMSSVLMSRSVGYVT